MAVLERIAAAARRLFDRSRDGAAHAWGIWA